MFTVEDLDKGLGGEINGQKKSWVGGVFSNMELRSRLAVGEPFSEVIVTIPMAIILVHTVNAVEPGKAPFIASMLQSITGLIT